jgi:hypothetical protein
MKLVPATIFSILILWLLVIAGSLTATFAQPRCVVRVELVNHNRYAYHTAEECEAGFHSVPWGNWGVNSNAGRRTDTDQFKGWHQPCSQTKVEWNSCSSRFQYRTADYLNFPDPNLYLGYPLFYPWRDDYSWNDFVAPFGNATNVDQYSPCGWNIYGSVQLTFPVGARTDTNGDGIFDKGGCLDLQGKPLTLTGNFMSVYELDSPDPDDLIQTMLFPDLTTTLRCTVDTCVQADDRNNDGLPDTINDFWGAEYKWPFLYENQTGVQSRADERRPLAKRLDASIRIGRVQGVFTN